MVLISCFIFATSDMISRFLNTKITALLLAFLFSGYYAGTTMFYHNHSEDGTMQTHSHPFGSHGHSHSQVEWEVIAHLSLIILVVTGIALIIQQFSFIERVVVGPVVNLYSLSVVLFKKLRAPPVL